MAHVAWKLTDSSTGSAVDFNFPINPNELDLPKREANIQAEVATAPSGGTIIFQGRDTVPRMSFAGVILTQAFYNDAHTWFQKRYPMVLTDDQSRTWTILITNFELSRRLSATNQWAFEYTVQGLLIT